MRKVFTFLVILGFVGLLAFVIKKSNTKNQVQEIKTFWEMQSIDTVKYSRDLAREKADDSTYANSIDKQMADIASTGATHVAIGTPYDKEFIPFMKLWVDAAHSHGMNVWFRGNFSGWESWFEYKKIGRDEHKILLKQFILDNGDLFKDGDVFTSCTECENGGPGDPRKGDVVGFRQFLIDEYQIMRSAFKQIDKSVASNYFPMNGDVAALAMNRETTTALGGLVVIDHYVATPELTAKGLADIAKSSGGKVVLGEFGAPIPDIQGSMTQAQQSAWIEKTLSLVSQMPEVIGINYWANLGSSTELWNAPGSPRQAVSTLKSYFKPNVFSASIVDETGTPVKDLTISAKDAVVKSENPSHFSILYTTPKTEITLSAPGYSSVVINPTATNQASQITLIRQNSDLIYNIRRYLHKFI